MSRSPLAAETPPSSSPNIVGNPPQLDALLGALSSQSAVAVDTESNSLYAYQEQICLIQFSTSNADYVVDPLAGLDLSPLGDVFADPNIQKVFHAAEYDIICLQRDFGFRFANLFDTMWAARILGWPHVGLGDVLREVFGTRTNKRYQRYNWGTRPLEPKALAYASLDTHYLLPLRKLQTNELLQKGHWEETLEIFDQVTASKAANRASNTNGFRRIKGYSGLSGREQAILRELYLWRDQEARLQNRPPFKVMNNATLIALAQTQPHTLDQITSVDTIKPYHLRRYGKRILRAIHDGLHATVPEPAPPPPRHSPVEVSRYQALRAWRKGIADRRGVDVDVILSNAVLWTLAERNPRTLQEIPPVEGLGIWKRRTYGKAILEVLHALP